MGTDKNIKLHIVTDIKVCEKLTSCHLQKVEKGNLLMRSKAFK